MAEKKNIEFNNGFVTALGLFYGHLSQFKDDRQGSEGDSSIYAAADHLFDMVIPENISKPLRDRIQKFRDDILEVRLKHITIDEAYRYFERCKQILISIDREFFGLLDTEVNYG